MKKPANREENMQLENEFLQLKLSAETGAETYFTNKLPLEIQNEFLKNIIEFENDFSKTSMKSVFKVLNEPILPLSSELNDHALEKALHGLIKLLHQKQITIDFLGKYDSRTKYNFIIEEIFKEKMPESISPGMTCVFIYEEFHPNHALEIEKKTNCFISDWVKQSIHENHPHLADTFTSPTGKIFRKDEIASKINKVFKSYTEFKNCHFTIDEVNFELNKDTGMGFADGYIKYMAVLSDKDEIVIEGPFKLYFNLEYDCWSIFYFVFPGFE